MQADHYPRYRAEFAPIPFDLHHALRSLGSALAIYAFCITLALLLSRIGVEDKLCLAVAHLGGALALAAFWRLGRWGRAKFDSFGAALLLVGVALRMQALIDALVYGARIEAIERYRNVPIPSPVIDLLLKGELITVIGLLLVSCSWRISVKSEVQSHSFLYGGVTIPRSAAWLVYYSAVAIDIIRKVFNVSFGSFDQFVSLLFIGGVASILFIASAQRRPVQQVLAAVVLAIPLSFLALDSGMKEEIFFPLVPAAILYWARFHSYMARAIAVCGAVLLLAFSQLYVHHVRDMAWRSTGDLEIPTSELASSFMGSLQDAKLTDALNHVSSRVNMTTTHAITVSLADNYGHEPVAVFGLIPASVIPRVLWGDKPIMQPGAMHTARVLGVNTPISEIRSATAAGFAAELYLGMGWLGVLVGAPLYGWLLAIVQRWSRRFGAGFGHQVLCFIALYWTIRFDEKHVVYAYTSILFAAAFVWILVKLIGTLGLSTSRR